MFGALFAAVGVYALIAGLAFVVQGRLMYPAPREPLEPLLVGATLHRIAGESGRTVYGFHAPAPEGAPTVVHFHGNGEALAHVTWFVEALRGRGLGVFALEYPGYGLAHAYATSRKAMLEDAETALAYLEKQLGVPRTQTVLVGHSLGTGVAAEMARRGLGKKLVLLSPYTSTVAVAQRIAPILPMRLLLRDQLDIERIAHDIQTPALVIHGTRDELIPVEMGQRVAKSLPRARLLLVDATHDLFNGNMKQLIGEIAEFASAD